MAAVRNLFIDTQHITKMQHEIVGEQFQCLKITMQSERVRGTYQKLLCKSEGINLGDGNIFSGTGALIFSGNGKIKQLYMGSADSIVLKEECILAADVETGQELLSTNYVSLVQFFGPGEVFICGKDFVEYYLEEKKTVEVRTQCITAMDSSVTFRLGSRFSELTGPGAILLESVIPEEESAEGVKEESAEKSGFSFFDQL